QRRTVRWLPNCGRFLEAGSDQRWSREGVAGKVIRGAPRPFMRVSGRFARTIVGLVTLATCARCGGGSSSEPSVPSPSPIPGVSACDVIGGAISASVAILNGTACSPANSSVVLVNMRDKDGTPTGACSGTVIASRAVLTAAHCLVGDTAAVRIFPGTGDEIPA